MAIDSQSVNIYWFRQDLRLKDNPALMAAIKQGQVLPIYILDDINAGENAMGAASRWWLHHSLANLNQALDNKLNFYCGDAHIILTELCKRLKVKNVHWNRCYEPWRIKRDSKIKQHLKSLEINVSSHNASLLLEPWQITKKDGTHYQMFTPYYKTFSQLAISNTPLAAPNIDVSFTIDPKAKSLADLALLPIINWDTGLSENWQPGEQQTHQRLQKFLATDLVDYHIGRDFPAKDRVSRLSAALHFGEISPLQIWHALSKRQVNDNIEHFKRELCWREFSYYLLFHLPHLATDNLRPAFDNFAWVNKAEKIQRWQQGKTGYPLVDAGMRELWQTGYMHNRVRMITASFLVKNLLIDWRIGAAWFWDCLVDADLANNAASWQWVAGSGADAAPYFRIFNPTTQAKKFDPTGQYIKRFLPELQYLPIKYLFTPWEAPEPILTEANIYLGTTYPKPMVDLKESRQRALDAYEKIKNKD